MLPALVCVLGVGQVTKLVELQRERVGAIVVVGVDEVSVVLPDAKPACRVNAASKVYEWWKGV